MDVGKQAEIFIVIGSSVSGIFTPYYLDGSGNLVEWNLSINSLEPAAIASPLEGNMQIRIFEGILQPGVHKIFIAYRVENGPLIYNSRALTVKVSE